jgi:hypothetical protein
MLIGRAGTGAQGRTGGCWWACHPVRRAGAAQGTGIRRRDLCAVLPQSGRCKRLPRDTKCRVLAVNRVGKAALRRESWFGQHQDVMPTSVRAFESLTDPKVRKVEVRVLQEG